MARTNRYGVMIACAVMAVALLSYWMLSENGEEFTPVDTTMEDATPPPTSQSGTQLAPVEQRTVPVAGIVRDQKGEPVPGAVVHVRRESSGDAVTDSRAVDMQTTEPTESDGRFAVHVSTAGVRYSFRANANGFFSDAVVVLVPEVGVSDLVLTLMQDSSLAGHVLSLDREPLTGVSVWAHSKTDTHARAQAPTGPEGHFVIANLREGVYSLSAIYNTPATAPPGWKGESYGDRPDEGPLAVVQLAPGERRDGLELILPWSQKSAVSGRTVDENGKPVPGATVWAAYDPMSLRPVGLAADKTDPSGAFRIPYVTQNRPSNALGNGLTLVAECPEYERVYLVDVAEGSANNTIVLPPARRGKIEGEVLDKSTGQPIRGAGVYMTGVKTDWGDYLFGELGYLGKPERKTDSEGRFSIDDLQTGIASLLVYRQDYGIASRKGIVVTKNEVTPVTLLLERAGTIEITIDYVDNLEGSKAYCYLTYWSADQGEETDGLALRRDMLDALEGKPGQTPEMVEEGVHAMVLSPGAYHVAAAVWPLPKSYDVLRSHRVAWHDIVLVKPGETTDITVEIGGNAVVQGYVDFPGADTVDPRAVNLAVYLVGQDDVSALEEVADPFDLGGGGSDTRWQARLPSELGYHQQTWVMNSSYLFPGVPPGSYSLVVVSTPKQKGEPNQILARKHIEVTEDATAVVDIP